MSRPREGGAWQRGHADHHTSWRDVLCSVWYAVRMALTLRHHVGRAVLRSVFLPVSRFVRPLAWQRTLLEGSTRTVRMPKSVSVTDVELGGRPARHLVPQHKRTDGHVLYLHGGAYVAGSLRSHTPIAALVAEAVGAFLLGNSGKTVMKTLGDFGKIIAGPKWKTQDYRDLLSLLFLLTKTMKTKGVIALETHIENPHDSSIFQRYPRIMKDHFAIDFICDTLRMMTMNLEDPHQVEDAMEKQLEKHHHEAAAPAHAMQNMADALPALGIVAAVLGIIKTMGAINSPPDVLGGKIGAALVGTFLGVFLAYGFVGPMAARLKEVYDEEHTFYVIIQNVLVAHLHGNAAQISVEIGRTGVPTKSQPSFAELETALGEIPAEA